MAKKLKCSRTYKGQQCVMPAGHKDLHMISFTLFDSRSADPKPAKLSADELFERKCRAADRQVEDGR